MGNSRWSVDDWGKYSTAASTKKMDDVFTSKSLDATLNPYGVSIRESRDSTSNPCSNAIIVGLDVTGSMGMLADVMAKKGLGTMVEEILKRKPVSDPHVMLMGIGDATCDRSPLQATQFEADISIAKQMEKLHIEKGGGGNSFESYNLPWYFGAFHTSIDCFEKRGKKGYLFTVGDEEAPQDLTAAQIKRILGDDVQAHLTNEQLLMAVQRMYNVFHIVVEEGSHARGHLTEVLASWDKVLGQRVIRLSDHTKLAEVVVSAIEVCEGRDSASVAGSWSGDTSVVVHKAIGGLTKKASTGSVSRL
jgi:hypothetical protein